jgi:hypothetical protein
LRAYLGGDGAALLSGADEAALWHQAREFAWVPQGWALVKIPLTPKRIMDLDRHLAGRSALRRYSGGGNVAWVALAEAPGGLHSGLIEMGLSGLVVFGPPGQVRIGARVGEAVERRVRGVLDPHQRFWTANGSLSVHRPPSTVYRHQDEAQHSG